MLLSSDYASKNFLWRLGWDAQKLAEQIGDNKAFALSQLNSGLAYIQLGDPEKAQTKLEASRELSIAKQIVNDP